MIKMILKLPMYRYIQYFFIAIFFIVPSIDTKPWSVVAKRYRKELAQEEKRIIAEFLVLSGRSKKEWKRWKNVYKKAFFHHIEKERNRESQWLNGKRCRPSWRTLSGAC